MIVDERTPLVRLHAAALDLEAAGALEAAATALDLAYRNDPAAEPIRRDRARVLDRLAVVEHGMLFRYVPAGSFIMGADDGEPDERPAHRVELGGFWITDVPVPWATFCALMDWSPPPRAYPQPPPGADEQAFQKSLFFRSQENKIRAQYCEAETLAARDWHAHLPDAEWRRGDGTPVSARELFGDVRRADPDLPWRYDVKPMVAVAWDDAVALGERLSDAFFAYRLPTEAEWEKAARGGLAGKRYPWGDAPPTVETCDFGRFDQTSIQPPRRFPPNGYGLFAMAGGVWEWTSDWYDAAYYAESPVAHPQGAPSGQQKVLRGGSWADCADAVRVSFRMALPTSRGGGGWGKHMSPSVGFRLVRERRAEPRA